MYSLWNPMNKSLLENSRMARPSIWPSTRNVQTTGRRLTNLAGMLIAGGFDGWFGGKWWWFMVSYGDFWDDLWRIDGWVYPESMRKKGLIWFGLYLIEKSTERCGRQRVFFCGWSAKCKPSLLDGPLGQLQQRFSCGAGHVKQKQRASIIKNTAYESSQTNKHNKMICDEGFRPLVFVFPDIEQGGLLCCPKLWRWLKSLQILES